MKFGVLGPLEVIADGRTVALPAAKHRALLAALLVRANQAAYGELAGAPFARAVAARLEEPRLAALEWRAEARLALQSAAAWTAAGERDASSGDRLDGILNAYWLGCDACSPRTRRPRPHSTRAWRWRQRDPSYPPK